MNIPGFNAELSLYKTAGRYALQSAWIGRSGNRVSLQQQKGCGPCIGGTKTCCFGFDPETGGPFCEDRPCTPGGGGGGGGGIDCGTNRNCGTHCCPPDGPCCASGCCQPGTFCCNNEGCCPEGTTCRRICIPFTNTCISFCSPV